MNTIEQPILPQIIRVMLRYVAAALVTYGVISPDQAELLVNHPELVGLVTALVTELWFTKSISTPITEIWNKLFRLG